MLLTCIINSVPHLKTTDGAGFVLIVTFEDQLQTQEGMDSQMETCRFVEQEQKLRLLKWSNLPLLDLFPQVFELLQVQFSGPIRLTTGQ